MKHEQGSTKQRRRGRRQPLERTEKRPALIEVERKMRREMPRPKNADRYLMVWRKVTGTRSAVIRLCDAPPAIRESDVLWHDYFTAIRVKDRAAADHILVDIVTPALLAMMDWGKEEENPEGLTEVFSLTFWRICSRLFAWDTPDTLRPYLFSMGITLTPLP